MITYFIYTVYQSSVSPLIDNSQQKKRLIYAERPILLIFLNFLSRKNTSDESNGINGRNQSLLAVIDDELVASPKTPLNYQKLLIIIQLRPVKNIL